MKLAVQNVYGHCFFRVMLCGLIVFGSLQAFSQEIEYTPPEYKNSIGVRVAQTRIGSTKMQPLKDYDALFGFGISYDRKLSRIIHLETGLTYLRKQLVISFEDDPSTEIPYEFYNFRMPILFKLESTYLYTSVGFNFDYMFKYSPGSDYYHDKIENVYDIHPFVVGAILNLGVHVPVMDRFLLNVEAGVMTDLTASVSEDSRTIKYSGYGYSAGISYKF
jgi:hypothetical protein